jgi:hypothetical protein
MRRTKKVAVTAARFKKSKSWPPMGLADLVSVGPATLEDFAALKIDSVSSLGQCDATDLYRKLSALRCQDLDPCVEDVFRCAIAQCTDPFLPEEKRKWFYWSRLRKSRQQQVINNKTESQS